MAQDGGTAFPLSREEEGWYERGMSLRDWFAGMAMQRILSVASEGLKIEESPFTLDASIARISYRMADAMLAERSKP